MDIQCILTFYTTKSLAELTCTILFNNMWCCTAAIILVILLCCHHSSIIPHGL